MFLLLLGLLPMVHDADHFLQIVVILLAAVAVILQFAAAFP